MAKSSSYFFLEKIIRIETKFRARKDFVTVNSESYFINSEKTLRMERNFKGGDVIRSATKKLTFYTFEIGNEINPNYVSQVNPGTIKDYGGSLNSIPHMLNLHLLRNCINSSNLQGTVYCYYLMC